jgi:hypothetical protein
MKKVILLITFVAASMAAIIWTQGGSENTAFGATSDEPSHYVSGMMILDYFREGSFSRGVAPLAWAESYYRRFPFFAVGHWPPVFYAAEAAWMSVFGTGKSQVLWLIALIGALTAGSIVYVGYKYSGAAGSLAGGAMFLLFPTVIVSHSQIMTDGAISLLSLWSGLALGKFLESTETKYAVMYTALASLTVLTKYSGLYLFVLPLASALLNHQRRDLLRNRKFWAMQLGVVLIIAPWFWVARSYLSGGLIPANTAGTMPERLVSYLATAYSVCPPFAVFAGLSSLVATAGLVQNKLAMMESLWLLQMAGIVLLQVTAPVPIDPRYLIPALPPTILLGCAVLGKLTTPQRLLALAVILSSMVTVAAGTSVPRHENNMAAIVHWMPASLHKILVPGGEAEGSFIAEMVSCRQCRVGKTLIRPGKLLASLDWMGLEYRELYTPPEMKEFLEKRAALDAIVLRKDAAGVKIWPHESNLAAAIKDSRAWKLVWDHGGYAVYVPGAAISER